MNVAAMQEAPMNEVILRKSGPLHDAALEQYVAEIRQINTVAGPMMNNALAILDPVNLAAARKRSNDGDALVRRDDFEDRFIDGPAGKLRLRIKSPMAPAAVLIDIHGGAFAMGSPEGSDQLNARYVERANVAVVSVDYRLAPEHPYPAGPDDCEAAAMWVMNNGKAEWGTDRVMITGASAGGNLAAVTLLRLRDNHDALANVVGANLVYGAYDLSGTPSQINQGKVAFRAIYLPDTPIAARKVADISPLYADLAGMPSALFTVGTNDYLYDDNLFMTMRWRAAGNDAELAVYPECLHGFTGMPCEMAKVANKRMIAWTAARAAEPSKL
jgi:acetyl esterase